MVMNDIVSQWYEDTQNVDKMTADEGKASAVFFFATKCNINCTKMYGIVGGLLKIRWI